MKYSFAIQNRFGETLKVDGADSFDEAIARVERALTERDLVVGRRMVDAGFLINIPEDIKMLLMKEGYLKAQPEAPIPTEIPVEVVPPAPGAGQDVSTPPPAPEAPATPPSTAPEGVPAVATPPAAPATPEPSPAPQA